MTRQAYVDKGSDQRMPRIWRGAGKTSCNQPLHMTLHRHVGVSVGDKIMDRRRRCDGDRSDVDRGNLKLVEPSVNGITGVQFRQVLVCWIASSIDRHL